MRDALPPILQSTCGPTHTLRWSPQKVLQNHFGCKTLGLCIVPQPKELQKEQLVVRSERRVQAELPEGRSRIAKMIPAIFLGYSESATFWVNASRAIPPLTIYNVNTPNKKEKRNKIKKSRKKKETKKKGQTEKNKRKRKKNKSKDKMNKKRKERKKKEKNTKKKRQKRTKTGKKEEKKNT